jgi:hypothetical protein
MRKIFLFLILLSLGIVGYSQIYDTISNPLEKFFQENYDSTVIIEHKNISNGDFQIVFISRKGNKLYNYQYYLYTPIGYPLDETNYSSVIDKEDVGPVKSKSKIIELQKLEKYKNTKPSINEYFYWYSTDSINYDTVKNLNFRNKDYELDYKENIKPLWLKLQKYNLWKIVKDSIKVSSVNSRENRNNYIKLITKDKVMSYRYNNFKNLEKEQRTLIKIISEYLSEVWDYFEPDSY